MASSVRQSFVADAFAPAAPSSFEVVAQEVMPGAVAALLQLLQLPWCRAALLMLVVGLPAFPAGTHRSLRLLEVLLWSVLAIGLGVCWLVRL